MTLFIAGINHFDPMGREHLANWLCSLADINTSPPSFIAVEFDEHLFKMLHTQRAQYRECIHNLWPGVPESDLDQYELSLGYEGDTHLECFYGTDVIWLDQGRTLPPGAVETHVHQRLQALQFFESRNALMLPGVVSEQVQPYTRAAAFSVERSRRFAEHILGYIHNHAWNWGIAITGASHASDRFQDSMRSLLVKAGVRCDTRIFCRLD
jgi:hypothetical protein